MAVFRLSTNSTQSEIKRLAEIAIGQGWELSAAAAPFSAAREYALYHVYSTVSNSGRRRHGRKQNRQRQFVAVWKSLESDYSVA